MNGINDNKQTKANVHAYFDILESLAQSNIYILSNY